MATRRDKGIVLWMMARACNPQGDGWVELKRFTSTLVRQRVYSGRTLRRHMAEEEDGFWSYEPARDGRAGIRLRSLLRVSTTLFKAYVREHPRENTETCEVYSQRISRMLGCYPGQHQAVPIQEFRSRGRARAWLHAVAFGTPLSATVYRKGKMGRSTQVVTPLGKIVEVHEVRKRAKPVARATMEAIEGRSFSTQRRYESAARVRVERNLDLCDEDGEIHVASDAPNTYRNRAEPINGGPARRVAGTLRLRGLTISRVTRRRLDTAAEYVRWAQRQVDHPPGDTVCIPIESLDQVIETLQSIREHLDQGE
jgi:hypothetical protein